MGWKQNTLHTLVSLFLIGFSYYTHNAVLLFLGGLTLGLVIAMWINSFIFWGCKRGLL